MKFGIIGFGRFGKLWAEILIPFGEVFVYDRNILDKKPEHNSIKFVNLFEVVKVDMLFLLVPISEIKNCCNQIRPLLDNKTLVIDACSVKFYPAKVMEENLPKDQPIIATHPLFGPDSFSKKGLDGHKIVICPIRTTNEQQKSFKDLLVKFNLKIIESSLEEHDQQMARSQALVHFVGRGLEDLKLQKQEISTPDYTAILQMNSMVHNDTEQLFLDMQKYNPYSKIIRESFLKGLQKIEGQIEKYE